MGMGFFMGMFVGGSVTLLHAGMAGGLKGLDRMAFKRSEHSHSAVKRRQWKTVAYAIIQMLVLRTEAHSLTAAAVRVICLLSSERSAEARHSASSSLSDLSCDRTKRTSREPPRRSLLGRLVQFAAFHSAFSFTVSPPASFPAFPTAIGARLLQPREQRQEPCARRRSRRMSKAEDR